MDAKHPAPLPLTADKARQLLNADKAARVQAAAAAIQKILFEQQCDLIAFPQLTPDGRIDAVTKIVAKG